MLKNTNSDKSRNYLKSLSLLLLQVVGLLLISLPDKYGAFAGIVYGVFLVLIGSYKSRKTKYLILSPRYLFLLIFTWNVLNLFLLRVPLWDPLESVIFTLFPTLIVGMIWLNIWTNRHSKGLYVTCALAVVFFLFLFFGYYLPLQHIGLRSQFAPK